MTTKAELDRRARQSAAARGEECRPAYRPEPYGPTPRPLRYLVYALALLMLAIAAAWGYALITSF